MDEKRLHKALENLYPLLTQAELKRNVRGDDRLYVSQESSSFKYLTGLYKNNIDPDVESDVEIDGMQGKVLLSEENIRQVISLYF